MTAFDLSTAETSDGDTVLFVLPSIPDDAPDEIREGIARRRVVSVTGQCPCGARLVLPNRAARRAAKRSGCVLHFAVEHEDDCPAVDSTLLARIREWRAGP